MIEYYYPYFEKKITSFQYLKIKYKVKMLILFSLIASQCCDLKRKNNKTEIVIFYQ